MKDTILAIRVGFTFLIGVGLIWVTYETLNEGSIFGTRNVYEIHGQFDTLKQLKPGDDVRLAGVKIGSVKKTNLEKGRAVAVLSIEDAYSIPGDAIATIDMAGLLGANFVGIQASPESTVAPIPAGGSIKTQSTPDFNTILSQVGDIGAKADEFFSQLSGSLGRGEGEEGGLLDGILGGVVEKLEKVIDENEAALKNAIANIETTTQNLAEGKGTLGKLINDDEAYNKILSIGTQLEEASQDIRKIVAEVQVVVADVKQGKGALGVLIYNEEVGSDITRITENVRNLTEQLSSGQGSLGRLIMEDDLYESAQGFINKAEKTLDGLGDSGPITAVGVAAGALF